jgi:hypothetical protein
VTSVREGERLARGPRTLAGTVGPEGSGIREVRCA